MATDSHLDQQLGGKPAGARSGTNTGPTFLRGGSGQQHYDPRLLGTTDALDEVDQHIVTYRAELESLANQILNLDNIIALEQQKLRESKATIDASFHARSRLQHLRTAMLHFVMELESRQTE